MSKKKQILKRPLPPSQLDLFPEHSHLLAKIISQWNFVEHGLITLMACIMRTEAENIIRMMKTLRTSSIRLDVIEAGIVDSMPAGQNKIHDQIIDILSRARRVLKRRNGYAHAYYFTEDEKRLRLADPSQMAGDKGFERVVTLTELKQTFTDVYSLGYEVAELCAAFGAGFEKWRDAEIKKSRTNSRKRASDTGI